MKTDLLASMPYTVVLRLTRSQQMALVSFLSDYMMSKDHLEVSIDVVTETETTLGEVFALVSDVKEIVL